MPRAMRSCTWLWTPVALMPAPRRTGPDGVAAGPGTLSAAVTAGPLPTGWRLIPQGTPVEGDALTPSFTTRSALGTLTWGNPPFTLPW